MKKILALVMVLSLGILAFNGWNLVRSFDLSVKDSVGEIAGPEGIETFGTIDLGYFSLPFSHVFDDDTNQDGRLDRRSYYDGDSLTLVAWDTRGDGQHDMWVQFTPEYLVDQEMYDHTGDGAIDEFMLIGELEEVLFTYENFRPEADPLTDTLMVGLPLLIMLSSGVVFLVLHRRSRSGTAARQTLSVLLAVLLLLSQITLSHGQSICNEDGTLNEAVFEREWQKYSDFREGYQSWEVQQYHQLQQRIDALDAEAVELVALMEYDRFMRLELREVKQSLVRNLQANLVRSFIRLSVLTIDGIKSGYDVGGKYAKMFTAEAIRYLPEGLSYFKNAMGVITGLTPDHGDSELAKTLGGYAGDAGDILKVVDNPKKAIGVARERLIDYAEDELKSFFPTVSDLKFSENELAILRTQNERNGEIDNILREIYKENAERRQRVMAIDQMISDLVGEQQEWMLQEKERVRGILEDACLRQALPEEDVTIGEDEPLRDPDPPSPQEPALPQSGIPTAYQLAGEYMIDYQMSVTNEGVTERATMTQPGTIEVVDENTLRFIEYPDENVTDMPYDPETGRIEMSYAMEGITIHVNGKAAIVNGQVELHMTVAGGDSESQFRSEMIGRKREAVAAPDGLPSHEELIGLYQMYTRLTFYDYEEDSISETSETFQVAVSLVNGRVALIHMDDELLPTHLDYDPVSGRLSSSYQYGDGDIIGTVEGQVSVESGRIQMQFNSLEEHPTQRFEGWHSLQKFQ